MRVEQEDDGTLSVYGSEPYADDYTLLSEYALQEKRQRTLREWVDSLRRSTYIDIRATDRYVAAPPQTSSR